MDIKIEAVRKSEGFTEFIEFYDQVYAYRDARWTAEPEFQLPILTGESALARDRIIQPFVAREGGRIVARAAAVVDQRYIRHWQEALGHIGMFEALPGSRSAVKELMNETCRWLESRAMGAARAGFHFATFDMPFAIDDYDSLPPMMVRQNPAYYHRLLKDAGFESEKGWVDYKIEVTPSIISRYEEAIERVESEGIRIVPMREIDPKRRDREFTGIWNESFQSHWGFPPMIEEESSFMLTAFESTGSLDTSFIAYRNDTPVGGVLVIPETTDFAVVRPGRSLHASEKLNSLGIGILESVRGRGVNLALAGSSFLELIRRGAEYLSYTMVYDDNWPSRRTAEKLGAQVCANYLVYRRNFR
jgi:hypothetical protein